MPPLRLALIVSHPIQYHVPLYQRLARRGDVVSKVFFTWHAAENAVYDRGFGRPLAWDIPMTEGYDFELVPNVSSDPGTHRFFGLRNPTLVERVTAWRPDAVHVTGWAWLSHLLAMRALSPERIPVLFHGDSHLLDERTSGPRWWIKQAALQRVYAWPRYLLDVGRANRAYYEAFGVEPARLHRCPHSIDVRRFAEPSEAWAQEAARWRYELGLQDGPPVLVYAGKFERKKQPVELMRAVQALGNPGFVLVMVGGGELEGEVQAIAAADPKRFRVLPFQNQKRMPAVYRLGELFILPSAYGETWGLAVNEAMACGRPVLVSNRVGCAADVVDASCGRVFSWQEPSSLTRVLNELSRDRNKLAGMGQAAARRAWLFDVAQTEAALMESLRTVVTVSRGERFSSRGAHA